MSSSTPDDHPVGAWTEPHPQPPTTADTNVTPAAYPFASSSTQVEKNPSDEESEFPISPIHRRTTATHTHPTPFPRQAQPYCSHVYLDTYLSHMMSAITSMTLAIQQPKKGVALERALAMTPTYKESATEEPWEFLERFNLDMNPLEVPSEWTAKLLSHALRNHIALRTKFETLIKSGVEPQTAFLDSLYTPGWREKLRARTILLQPIGGERLSMFALRFYSMSQYSGLADDGALLDTFIGTLPTHIALAAKLIKRTTSPLPPFPRFRQILEDDLGDPVLTSETTGFTPATPPPGQNVRNLAISREEAASKGLCYYCKEAGHVVSKCPNRKPCPKCQKLETTCPASLQ